jgi:hypothetical protein
LQVTKVSSIAADSTSHVLNYVSTDLDEASSTAATDCPRFTETRSKVENFNLDGFNQPQETVVTNSLTTGASYSLPGSITGSATRIDVAMTGHPDGLYSRTYVGASGWREGLPIATEDCIGTNCSDRKRWTWTSWTQDDEESDYILNPRVEESRVGDSVGTKKSTIEYWLEGTSNVSTYGLVKSVYVYDGSTVLKQSYTTYNLDSAYTSRRIIGLPSTVEQYGLESSGLNLVSKLTYQYDADDDFNTTGLNQNISPVQHDSTNYGPSISLGRGNLTSTTRWNAQYPTSETFAVTSGTKYNTAGSVVSQTDPLGRMMKISYADSFNSTVGVSTYAYPTVITDPNATGFDDADHRSTIQYRYDIGANIEANSPAPAENGSGKRSRRTYDDQDGRLAREGIWRHNGSAWIENNYSRYIYPDSGTQSMIYSTLVDADGDGNIAEDEVLTETFTDGAGRVRRTRVPHTFSGGNTATWAATVTEYDILVRVKRQSIPTEVNSTWSATGDDSAFLWNSREYDWKGRTTRTIPSDSNGTDGKDTLYEFTGCGCAGNQVTVVKGPITTAIDASGAAQTTKRRVQKIHQDILGRSFKTELWDLDGAGTSPYSTMLLTFNGRDQVVLNQQYQGGTGGSTHQDTITTFDGHGRLLTRHNPIEDSSTSTSWTYYSDDKVATVTDPRGAVTTFTYGNPSISEKRSVLRGISYSVPSESGVPDPTDVSFQYDNVGNRTQMQDGSGVLNYEYDSLSRLTAEKKDFTEVLDNEPSGGYRLDYTYNIGGALRSIESPFDEVVSYPADITGRVTGVGASGFESNRTSFASGITYRAFGGVKAMTYSTTTATNIIMTYNAALRTASFSAQSSANSEDIHNKGYSYYNDGTPKQVDNNVDANYSQSFEYDFAGRLRKNAVKDPNASTGRYEQTLGYDVFSNISSRATTIDGATQRNFTAGYTNHRKTSGGYASGTDTFDAAGNVTFNIQGSTLDRRRWTYDAAGRMTEWLETSKYLGDTFHDQGAQLTFDGDGRMVKRLNQNRLWANPPNTFVEEPEYFIYSSVTGQQITVLKDEGERKLTNVYLGSTLVAEHSQAFGTVFKHKDPLTGSVMQTEASGEITPYEVGRIESAALGTNIPMIEPEIQEPERYDLGGSMLNPEYGCVDPTFHDPVPCNVAALLGAYVEGIDYVVRERIFREKGRHPHPPPSKVDNFPFSDDDVFADNHRYGRAGFLRIAKARSGQQEPNNLEYYWVFNLSRATFAGPNIKSAARTAFEEFLRSNKGCADLAKTLGLGEDLEEADFILADEQDLKTTLASLGFKQKDIGDTSRPLADAEREADALTNFRTNKVYVFQSALFVDRVFPNASKDKAHLGGVIFHETFHLKFDGGHEKIAQKLGLTYDQTSKDQTDRDKAADKAIEDFVANDCKKP